MMLDLFINLLITLGIMICIVTIGIIVVKVAVILGMGIFAIIEKVKEKNEEKKRKVEEEKREKELELKREKQKQDKLKVTFIQYMDTMYNRGACRYTYEPRDMTFKIFNPLNLNCDYRVVPREELYEEYKEWQNS